MNEPDKTPKGSRRRAELAAMSLEDFKQLIAGTCGPREKKDRPGLVRPGDRTYSKVGPPATEGAK